MPKTKNITPYIILGVGITASLVLGGYLVFRRKKVPCNSRFLFIGDSNTVMSSSYSKQLKQYCPMATVKELAASGRNTSAMLQSLQSELNAGHKYDVIAILGGSNDLGTGIDTKSNLQALYDMAKKSGAKVIAITPPSKNFIRLAQPDWGGANYNGLLAKLADIVSWQLNNRTPDLVVNWNRITNRKDYFSSDMQHANATAHNELLKEIVNRLPIKK